MARNGIFNIYLWYHFEGYYILHKLTWQNSNSSQIYEKSNFKVNAEIENISFGW